MTRVVLPNLFSAWSGVISTKLGGGIALRWMTAPALGLPHAPFNVWRFVGTTRPEDVDFTTSEITGGWSQHSWVGGRPAAAVRVSVGSASGSARVRAHSGPNGAGQVVDEQTVTGTSVTLLGSSISSISTLGSVTVTGIAVVDLQTLVDSPDWELIELVGLPVDDRFAGNYSLDPQGPLFDLADPVEAAIRRVHRGTPSLFWPATTDGGLIAPDFEPPRADVLVTEELAPIMEQLSDMVQIEPNRSAHADFDLGFGIRAPASVHGVDAPTRWQNRSSVRVKPLGTTLLAAGTDGYAALALGYGTTIGSEHVDLQDMVGISRAAATNPGRGLVLMVTLEHKVDLEVQFGPAVVSVPFEGELASLVISPDTDPPPVPTGLTTEGSDGRGARLDRPANVDERWLEIVDLSWDALRRAVGLDSAPASYAVLSTVGAADPEVLLDERIAGGHRPHVTAITDDPTRVHFTQSGVEEAFPLDPTIVTYSIAAQDWFGRWGPWRSVDHPRLVVPPQRPAMSKVELEVDNNGFGPGASAAVEFAWDWADRRPENVHVRLRVHVDGDEPPTVAGSVLIPGGPVDANHTISFAGATPDVAPTGVAEIVEERAGDIRKYRVVVPGVTVPFMTSPRIRITADARASERVRPGLLSGFSNVVSSAVMSPIPPPAPVIPAAMRWASLADPAGISRASLSWNGVGPTYAVYLADETAIARELGLASPDLDTPTADRLVALRSQPLGAARRAFRRVAERLDQPRLDIALPRGSRLIQFYGIASVSATGAERPLPADANQYLAVATPERLTPTAPLLRARSDEDVVALTVEIDIDPVEVDRIEVTRVIGRRAASIPQAAGPPLLTASASAATSIGDIRRWELSDADALPHWQPVFYRAFAWAEADAIKGEISGRSVPTGAVEVVKPAPNHPEITAFTVVPDAGGVLHTVSFGTSATRTRTHLGVFSVAVTAVHSGPTGPQVTTRRANFDTLHAVTGPLARPEGDVFLHRPSEAQPFRVHTILTKPPISIVVEVTDPLGRRVSESWEAP